MKCFVPIFSLSLIIFLAAPVLAEKIDSKKRNLSSETRPFINAIGRQPFSYGENGQVDHEKIDLSKCMRILYITKEDEKKKSKIMSNFTSNSIIKKDSKGQVILTPTQPLYSSKHQKTIEVTKERATLIYKGDPDKERYYGVQLVDGSKIFVHFFAVFPGVYDDDYGCVYHLGFGVQV